MKFAIFIASVLLCGCMVRIGIEDISSPTQTMIDDNVVETKINKSEELQA